MNSPDTPSKNNSMYLAIVCVWVVTSIILWLDFFQSFHILNSAFSKISAGLITLFIDLGWLYGFYHIGILTFGLFSSKSSLKHSISSSAYDLSPPIAILYTVCDDFQYEAAFSCVGQEYPHFHVYILDDSSGDETKETVDTFRRDFEKTVSVIRRHNRQGYKAGNLNNALSKISEQYEYIALVDSDTHLPHEFLKKTAQLLDANPFASFVQTLHVVNSHNQEKFAKDLGDIVRIGWNYYQLVRNTCGFPMCYGHGALIRFKALKAVGGFPEIVSEDIALTLRLRGLGFLGFFTSDAICGEDYPNDYHTFRKRLSRWVPADLECFRKELFPFLFINNVTLVEKLDALFRGLKVPLASLFLPLSVIIGFLTSFCGSNWDHFFTLPTLLITLLTSLAPYYCFILDMWDRPNRLFLFLSCLTTVYCSCSFLFLVRAIEALTSGKAQFHVSGAKYEKVSLSNSLKHIFTMDATGYPLLGVFEIFIGGFLIIWGVYSMNFVLIGIAVALALAPAIYAFGWNNRFVSQLVYIPFIFIILGIASSCFWGSEAQCLVLAGFSILLF